MYTRPDTKGDDRSAAAAAAAAAASGRLPGASKAARKAPSADADAASASNDDDDDEDAPNRDENYFGSPTGMAPTPVRMYHALGETFKVPKVVKPMAQHGNVVLNSEVHLNLRDHRAKLRAINRQKLNQLPAYPPGMTPDTENIQLRDLVFAARPKATGDRRMLGGPGSNPNALFSSWNDKPVNQEFVFMGVADTAAQVNRTPGQTMTGKFVTAIAGTRTILIGPKPVYLGDDLMWEEPYMVQKAGSNEIVPGLRIDGTPSSKCVAHAAPMSFKDYRSTNIAASTQSFIQGTFQPADNVEAWAKYHALNVMLLEFTAGAGTVADKEFKELAAHSSTVDVTLQTKWAQDQHLALVRTNRFSANASSAKAKFFKTPRAVFIMQIQIAISYWYNDILHFHLTRKIGRAMSAGQNGQGDAYINRGG